MTFKQLTAIGVVFGLGTLNAFADEVCGIGRVAMDLEGTVQIAPQSGVCALLDKKLVVSRNFPTSQFLFDLGVDGTCFVGQIDGNVTIAGKTMAVEGRSFSAQYASGAFAEFAIPGTPFRTVFDLGGGQWFIGDANTYVELTKAGQTEPFLEVAFDDTFFYTAEGADTEKFTAVSPGVRGTLVAEGPIFWPGAPIKGRLCVAKTLLW